eukprot:TRINITY_DN71830_c0_g1_i1.p2 TRINITY_DN71830_c0_g1~~TRINITY_DN71830_c0_g1_i1.p2  ORF type:complete len:179 (-),score=16.37 TRINITY_DN71830_c0_g1_i1:70-606(-)
MGRKLYFALGVLLLVYALVDDILDHVCFPVGIAKGYSFGQNQLNRQSGPKQQQCFYIILFKQRREIEIYTDSSAHTNIGIVVDAVELDAFSKLLNSRAGGDDNKEIILLQSDLEYFDLTLNVIMDLEQLQLYNYVVYMENSENCDAVLKVWPSLGKITIVFKCSGISFEKVFGFIMIH